MAEHLNLDHPDSSDTIASKPTPRGLVSAWRFRKKIETSGAGPLPERLLRARGIENPVPFDEAGYKHVGGPETLSGAVEAGTRLAQAVADGRRIVIHGDYDFDGIASSSILHRAIRASAPDHPVEVVLPDRYTTGYGLSIEGLLALRNDGVDLVIAVDCGITAHEAIAAAAEVGLETMVLDHHTIPRTADGAFDLPPASVVVHPHLPLDGEDEAPERESCGATIAFKVAWAFATAHHRTDRLPEVIRRELVEATILAGLGTIADVMPLVGENRALATLALRNLGRTSSPGLRALLAESGHDPTAGAVHEETVQFQLAPRVNALGRFGSAMPAIELLCEIEDDDAGRARAGTIASGITRINEERREEERRIIEEAATRAESEGQLADDHPMIVLAAPGWRRGLVGPACAKLSERFGRPVLLMEACDDGLARGSARSIPGYSIHDGLMSASSVLERFGGHAAAAGFTLRTDRVEELRAALVVHARSVLDGREGGLVPVTEIDCTAAVDEVSSIEDILRLRVFAPYGQGHPKPVVLIEAVRPIEIRWVGGEKDTLQLQIPAAGRRTVKAVWFRVGRHRDLIDATLREGPVDLVVSPDLNRWRGREEPQWMIQDIRGSHG